jgi:hypothetical protein
MLPLSPKGAVSPGFVSQMPWPGMRDVSRLARVGLHGNVGKAMVGWPGAHAGVPGLPWPRDLQNL